MGAVSSAYRETTQSSTQTFQEFPAVNSRASTWQSGRRAKQAAVAAIAQTADARRRRLAILDNGVSIGGFKSEKDAQRFLLMNGDRHRDTRPDDDLAFIIIPRFDEGD